LPTLKSMQIIAPGLNRAGDRCNVPVTTEIAGIASTWATD